MARLAGPAAPAATSARRRAEGASSGMQYAIRPALWRVDNVLGRNFISDVLAGDRNYEY